MAWTKTQETAVKTALSLTTRSPAVAGHFYPAQAQALARAVQKFLDAAPDSGLHNVRAIIAPHAGYVCSGSVAAASFKTLCALPKANYTVYLLGPAHYAPVHGVGLSGAKWFATPLGVLPVAGDLVKQLLGLGAPYCLADQAHAPEHSLEVELPFLQMTLGEPRIAPMLLGVSATPEQIAADLVELLAADESGLVVVSSDLSHRLAYHEAYTVDRAFLAAVAAGDLAQARQGQACGLTPILVLMTVARRLGWQAHLLTYANSGDTCGPRDAVVGYGALAYTSPR